MTKKPLIGAVVVLAAVGAYLVTRPAAYRVERSTTVNALVTIVFNELEDFKMWSDWSAWERRDPRMKKVYGGPPIGIGSTFTWQGDDTVGEGRMTVIENEAPIHVKYRLELTRPHGAVGTITFDLAPQGPEATAVTWMMEGTRDLKGKLGLPFVNSPETLSEDFATGLVSLKRVSEAKARVQATTEATHDKRPAEPRAKTVTEAAPPER